MSAAEMASEIANLAGGGGHAFVAGHNLHSLYLVQVDATFREFYRQSSVVLIDGFPVLIAARRAARKARAEVSLPRDVRIGSTDWIPLLSNHATVRRIAIVGASDHSNSLAVERLQAFPSSPEVLGLPGSGWTSERAEEVVAMLCEFEPQLVLVGLGMPRQEAFLLEYRDRLPEAVYATVGGAIDQIAGVQRPAPRWLGQFGAEWAWRLATQPTRLGHRYLIEPFKLLGAVRRRVRFEAVDER